MAPQARLVILCPTLGRPGALEPLARAFADTTPRHRLLFIVDADDVESATAARRAGDVLVSERTGYSAKINAGIRATNEPLILLAADDVRPHPDWFETAAGLLSNTIGFVSLNDLGNRAVMRGRLATFPLVARWYVEKYGDLLHEGYRHNCCDVEATELAMQRGAFAFARGAVMEHMHPLWNKGEMDKTYEDWALDPEGIAADRALLAERRKLWA
jgi:glycosyltransferase involved in cell wall biosynthesis